MRYRAETEDKQRGKKKGKKGSKGADAQSECHLTLVFFSDCNGRCFLCDGLSACPEKHRWMHLQLINSHAGPLLLLINLPKPQNYYSVRHESLLLPVPIIQQFR